MNPLFEWSMVYTFYIPMCFTYLCNLPTLKISLNHYTRVWTLYESDCGICVSLDILFCGRDNVCFQNGIISFVIDYCGFMQMLPLTLRISTNILSFDPCTFHSLRIKDLTKMQHSHNLVKTMKETNHSDFSYKFFNILVLIPFHEFIYFFLSFLFFLHAFILFCTYFFFFFFFFLFINCLHFGSKFWRHYRKWRLQVGIKNLFIVLIDGLISVTCFTTDFQIHCNCQNMILHFCVHLEVRKFCWLRSTEHLSFSWSLNLHSPEVIIHCDIQWYRMRDISLVTYLTVS